MLTLSDLTSVSRVLLLGAHCDDIEIGCGGTVLRLLEANPGIRVDWVVFSSDARRAAEARAGAAAFLGGAEANVVVEQFRGRFFPYVGVEIKEYFDGLGASTSAGRRLHAQRPGPAPGPPAAVASSRTTRSATT